MKSLRRLRRGFTFLTTLTPVTNPLELGLLSRQGGLITIATPSNLRKLRQVHLCFYTTASCENNLVP